VCPSLSILLGSLQSFIILVITTEGITEMSAGITSRMYCVYLKPSHCSCVEFYYADICLPSIMLQELCTSCSRVAFNQSLYTVPVVFATAQTVLCTYPLLTSLDAVSVDPWVCTLVRVFQVSISFRSNRLLECFTQVLNICHNVFYLVWSMP
jgi:hypothetical protein